MATLLTRMSRRPNLPTAKSTKLVRSEAMPTCATMPSTCAFMCVLIARAHLNALIAQSSNGLIDILLLATAHNHLRTIHTQTTSDRQSDSTCMHHVIHSAPHSPGRRAGYDGNLIRERLCHCHLVVLSSTAPQISCKIVQS
jgi:hypothetical protein